MKGEDSTVVLQARHGSQCQLSSHSRSPPPKAIRGSNRMTASSGPHGCKRKNINRRSFSMKGGRQLGQILKVGDVSIRRKTCPGSSVAADADDKSRK